MNNLATVERASERAFARDLAAHQAQEVDAEMIAQRIEELASYKLEEALNDETAFINIDDNYEVIDKAQVMRALRNLDKAIKRFNTMHDLVLAAALTNEWRKDAESARIDIDAVFSALHNIQQNVKSAVSHEAETEVRGSQP